MKTVFSNSNKMVSTSSYGIALLALLAAPTTQLHAEINADFYAIPPTISTDGASDLPNVLVILDNSNSMDESASGAAVDTGNNERKSEIARLAVKDLIINFTDQMRMGLMAYQQTGIGLRQIHNTPYDASFDPANYDPTSTADRDSLIKKYRILKPGSATEYIYYNIALPFYSGGDSGTVYCYSDEADFDNDTNLGGDTHRCFREMTMTTDPDDDDIANMWGNTGDEDIAGWSDYWRAFHFGPTDSDIAQDIYDFGRFMAWYHVGPTWFSNSSPGEGYLHTPIALLDSADSTQIDALNTKLDFSDFVTNGPTNPAQPLQNAGLTPLEGTLQTALDYFSAVDGDSDGDIVLDIANGGTVPVIPANVCSDKDFVVLVTDGLPSTRENGSNIADTASAIAAVAAKASDLLAAGIRTYVVGYALPEGVDEDVLDEIAIAGGTSVSYLADDSATLSNTLTGIFTNILNRTSAGSAAAVVSNSISGEGALYQALYDPSMTISGQNVTWGGRLHSIFIDANGLFREDGNSNAQLDNYSTDPIVEIRYDSLAAVSKVYRYATSDGDTSGVTPTEHDLHELNTIWDARDQLSVVADLTTQRSYSALANTGRHIFTWLDSDTDGVVDSGETADFVSATFPTGAGDRPYRYLDVPTTSVSTLVNYIRGEEGLAIAGTDLRPRTIDYDDDSLEEVWRLGDIIHSSPVVVGKPSDTYYIKYSDYTYQTYISQYADRRQVVYVGANDGMLHAFNGGFWNSSTTSFNLTDSTSTSVSHPLGSELWAYVPHNLLPHLKWLANPDYAHVYYVDGAPQAFDVRIFEDDATHPGGWGTILVVGMRFGGGDYDLDIDAVPGDDITTRSAYIVLDITDPESAPTLIAEISDENLGYTTGAPTLVKQLRASITDGWNTPDVNNWYLAFGSGPTDLDGQSDQNAYYYLYDLGDASLDTPRLPEMVTDYPEELSATTSFVGGSRSVDWDFDYYDDVIYFGLSGESAGSNNGSLQRMDVDETITDSSISALLASTQPITATPYTLKDSLGANWVYVGSGRFLDTADNTDTEQQIFYGIKDDLTSSVSLGDMVDTTYIQVFADGSVLDPENLPTQELIIDSTSITNADGLKSAIQGKDGWYVKLEYDSTSPSSRVTNVANSFGRTVLFVDYQPNADSCTPEGNSNLFARDFQSGAAPAFGPLGFDSGITYGSEPLALSSVSLGTGFSSAPVIHTDQDGDIQVITQSSTAEVGQTLLGSSGVTGGRQSWRIIEDWRL